MVRVLLAFVSLFAGLTLAWKAAVLTDVHVNPNYYQNITASSFCEKKDDGKEVYTDQLAPFGRFGCDPPAATLEL